MPRGEEAKRGGKRGIIGARVDDRSQLQRDKRARRAEVMEGRWTGRWLCWWRKDAETEARLFWWKPVFTPYSLSYRLYASGLKALDLHRTLIVACKHFWRKTYSWKSSDTSQELIPSLRLV
jgi:hypothetical protein